ncbi:MAG: hypothetical protein AAF320_05015 [Myxococcota bacterium]
MKKQSKNIFLFLLVLIPWATGCGDPEPVAATTSTQPTHSQPTYKAPKTKHPIKKWKLQLANHSKDEDDVNNDSNASESSGPFIHLKGQKVPPENDEAVAHLDFHPDHYELHHVRGDGSCEVRARTLRLVAYFAVEHPELFDHFINNLRNAAHRYKQQDERFARRAKWQEAIFLLQQLKDQSLREIIHSFNSEHFEEIVIEKFIRPFWAASIREGIVTTFIEQIDSLMKIAIFLKETQINQNLIEMKNTTLSAKKLIIDNEENAMQLNAGLSEEEDALRIAYAAKRARFIVYGFEEAIPQRRENRSFQLAQFTSSRNVEKAKNWGFKAIPLYIFFKRFFGLPLPENAKDGLVILFSHPQKQHMDLLIKKGAL